MGRWSQNLRILRPFGAEAKSYALGDANAFEVNEGNSTADLLRNRLVRPFTFLFDVLLQSPENFSLLTIGDLPHHFIEGEMNDIVMMNVEVVRRQMIGETE